MAIWLSVTLLLAPLWVTLTAGRGRPLLALAGPITVILGYMWLTTGGSRDSLSALTISPWVGHPALSIGFDESVAGFAGWVAPLVLCLVLIYGHVRPIERPGRFYTLLALFFMGAELLLLSGGWLTLLLGWELMGLTSYALIAHPSLKDLPGRMATRVFLVNRVGDIALVVAVAIIYQDTGQLGFGGPSGASIAYGPIVSACLLLAALTKSAQFPFSRWLLWAMAGPTPVSALLHSATLVSAGAIMLVKAGPLYGPVASVGVGVCLATAALGVIRSCVAGPAKAVLAHSTYSHIGLAMAGILAGALNVGYLHLISHALPKAALFLTAGLLGATVLPPLGVGLARGLVWVWPQTAPARREAGRRAALGLVILSLAGAGLLSGALTKDGLLVGLRGPAGEWFAPWLILYTLGTLGYSVRLILAWVLAPAHKDSRRASSPLVWVLTWLPVFAGLVAALPWGLFWQALDTTPFPLWAQLYPWVTLALVATFVMMRPQPLWSAAWGYLLFRIASLRVGWDKRSLPLAHGLLSIGKGSQALLIALEQWAQFGGLWAARGTVMLAHGMAALDHVGQFAVSLAGRGVRVTTLTLLGGGESFAPGRAAWLAVALAGLAIWVIAYWLA